MHTVRLTNANIKGADMITKRLRATSMAPVVGMDVLVKSWGSQKGTIRLISASGKTMYVSLDIFVESSKNVVLTSEEARYGKGYFSYSDKQGNRTFAWKFTKKADGFWTMARTGECIDLADNPND